MALPGFARPADPSQNRETDMSRVTPRVLAADDQPDVLEALRLLLKPEGFLLETAESPAGVLAAAESRELDVVLMDLNYTRDTTSGREGMDLLARLQVLDPSLPVVVMTAWGSVDVAVEAMRRGARDFVQKPWENARLVATLRTQAELARALRRGQSLEAENRALREEGRPLLIAESVAMRPVLEMIERVGPSDANVLVTGENGTGKGTVAAALHAVSARSGKPLLTVNAGGLSEGVFESELFGHVKGAFTDAKADRVGRFEMADGGALFLDEIANVPMNLQPKLLRVLETGEFERVGSSRTRRADVRVLSATNADVRQEVANGRFRQDLLFRLNTIEIHVPPLRDRREDIPLLAGHFLRLHARRYRKDLPGFHADALKALGGHAWPGNVRELDHAVERAVLMARGTEIREADLGLRGTAPESPRDLENLSLEEVEAFLIKKALQRHGGSVSHAASTLGLSRSALYRRLQRYGL
jgi:DNA-binding NtrC family response regulator